MNFGCEEHFKKIVVPAWQDYLSAEQQLTLAGLSGDLDAFNDARYTALRKGGDAAIGLHHFVEKVAAEDGIPGLDLAGLRAFLGTCCFSLRSNTQSQDVSLLGDVADALKHSQLRNQKRDVAAADAVLVVETGFADLPFGEGKCGGAAQVVVLAKSGKRPLSSVLQNVVDAWRRAFGWALPEIGRP